MAYRSPGPVTLATMTIFATLCFLDSWCLLPHPPPIVVVQSELRTTRFFASSSPSSDAVTQLVDELKARADVGIGLPSGEVRRNYKARLQVLSDKLSAFRRETNVTETAPCSLAAVAVQEREGARIEARLKGPAAMHAALMLRDLWVYQSLEPFTLQNMMQQKRSKMTKSHPEAPPSDHEVCLALVESSTQSNKNWDLTAEATTGANLSYGQETLVMVYLPVSLVITMIAYFSEVLCCRRKKKNTD